MKHAARHSLRATPALAVFFVAQAAAAGDWVNFADETPQRLTAPSNIGLTDAEERDYAWGDLNNNGWIDLVAMRKQPFTTPGKRRNVLFMNEGGVLVDRTAEYASASDVTGDDGFLTPTSDRDSAITDVNADGWRDVVTSVMLGDGSPKHISHPRVYVNLAEDRDGEWLGLRYEDSRIPQLAGLVQDGPYAGHPHAPWFYGVAAGDVTGNGTPDLFFCDIDLGPAGMTQTLDFNDRLLVNDGNGFFTDDSSRMPGAWLESSFATSAVIADFNGNGINDIVRNNASQPYAVRVMYNNPGNVGFFIFNQFVVGASPNFVNAADLNNNGRLDLVVSRDGSDLVNFNLGTSAIGEVQWSGSIGLPLSDGFRSNVTIADLDNSGWPDILIADLHIDLPNCSSEFARMYRNNANGPQPSFTMDHGNLLPADFQNVFDVAAFDLTGNGWTDLVLARGCLGTAGTRVLVNQGATRSCAGDFNMDGTVNVADLLALLSAWGECPSPGFGSNCPADLTGDGTVNVADLLALLSAWGSCPAGG